MQRAFHQYTTADSGRLGQALISEAANERIEKAQSLIARGASLDEASGDTGFTALIWSAIREDYNMAKLLLESGANPDHQDKQGRSALFYAVARDDLSIALLLTMHGASLDLVNKENQTVFNICISQGMKDDLFRIRNARQKAAEAREQVAKDHQQRIASHIEVQENTVIVAPRLCLNKKVKK